MGRDRLALAGPAVGATFLGGLGGAMARSAHPYPRPGASAEEIRRYFTQPSRAPLISVAGQLLSAASLLLWGKRVSRLGQGSPDVQAKAVAGGALGAGSLAVSAGCAATLAWRPVSDAAAVRIHRAAFLAGGPTHGFGFGLLLAGLGSAGRRSGRLPEPLARAALASAVPNLLSPAYLVWDPAAWLIPIGRFPGLIVTAAAGARLASAPASPS
jgi:hypothetical protein